MHRRPPVLRRSAARGHVVAAAVLAIAALGLAGCTPAAEPQPEPTETSASPTPEPTETEGPATTSIVLDGDSLDVLRSDGEQLASYTFDQTAAEVMAALSLVIGENATTETITDDPCYPTVDRASWGGLHIWSSLDGVNKPEDAQYFVTVDGDATVAGVPITMPSGQGVGAGQDEVIDANLGAPSYTADDGVDLYYDVRSGTSDDDPSAFYGAIARLQDEELVELRSPVYYLFEC